MTGMTTFRMVLNSLRFHWRMHFGVLLGTALAAAILTGGLLVGDSVDFSLRQQALARLGDIHYAVESRKRFFSDDLARRLRDRVPASVATALDVQGMAIATEDGTDRSIQINRVKVLGVDTSFWGFDRTEQVALGPYETAINARLAQALDIGEGDEVALRIAKPGLLSRDAPLAANEEETSIRVLCTVRRVLPDSSLGRFSLSANQSAPYNAFVDLGWLQEQTELAGLANLVLVGDGETPEGLARAVREVWQPEHVGLRFRKQPEGTVQLETDRIFLDAAVAKAALTPPDALGTLAYMVNSIAKGDRLTPYSFAVAGPVPDGMGDDEIVVNRWVADQLGANPGDAINLKYYELTASNDFVEKERAFKVHSVVEMADLAVERALMPEFPGLSDVERCEDWDVGMPMDEDLLKDEANEAYWEAYHQTPKVLVTLAAGQAMWANRFGDLTAVRYPGGPEREAEVREVLRREVDPAAIGLVFAPVRQQALDAVSQAMDLGGLFLGMSFFLIIAALILTGLLFVFGVQQRASEMGILQAVGYRPGQVRRLFLVEGAVVAIVGAAAGAWAGTVYTRVLIFGLSQYWQGAVANAAILYHAAPNTVITGAGISLLCAMGAMAAAMWRQTLHTARDLLAMDFTQGQTPSPARGRRAPGFLLPAAGFALAILLVVSVQVMGVDDVVMPFFGAGSLLLLSGLGLCRYLLGRLDSDRADGEPTLLSLALQNVSRRRGRSMSVAALLAAGCFLVLAVSSMQADVTAHADRRWSGTGGFALFAESTVPMTGDPAAEMDDDAVRAVAIRVRDGDDASCLNLNHALTPRLLGINVDAMAALGAFVPEGSQDGLWEVLKADLPDGAVPALVGDTDTAMWGLKKKAGLEDGDLITYKNDGGDDFSVKLVGCLPMRLSVFQGSILISDEAFTRLFPSEDGFRMFLVDTAPGEDEATAVLLNASLSRFGFDAIPAVDRLREFYTVESTYLAMFLVLGGLGLVLGSAALGIVVLRNLFERRREVALLRAVGFRQGALFRLFLSEYGLLLAMGIVVGGVAAAVAMVPAVTSSASTVSFGLQAAIVALIACAGMGCIGLAVLAGLGRQNMDALRDE
jgi:putative ABC transport system permease protein